MRVLIYSLIVGLALYVSAPVLIFGFLMLLDDPCETDIAQVTPSPDGTKKAVLYQFDCGATTPFTTNVSIIDAAESIPSKLKSVFTAHGGSRSGSWHGPFATVQWTSNVDIEIAFVSDAKVTKQETNKDLVRIRYHQIAIDEIKPEPHFVEHSP